MLRNALAASFAVFSLLSVLSCATGPGRERDLVSRAVEASGGAQALAAINTVYVKGTWKQWEPEQSEAPGARCDSPTKLPTSSGRTAVRAHRAATW